MLYINSFLDRMGEIIRGEKSVEEADKLLDQKNIFEMFRSDCEEILNLYKSGKAEKEEVQRNFYLLKTYVVSQLSIHFERLKDFAESKGFKIEKKLDPEVINEIALYIDRVEKEV
ncbi:MAG: hypothetical protein XD40_2157 [Archaeoglobus fulgidus]|uniref:Uncharacterized protein n=1 Tax=Archaeoglobus fulgidus TaxID=2234 RepID=A0A124F7U5_ARCFL|nr:hypothetical protein [Archaeoglobus fulgidus]KUJ92640.1 MAG: hypothetical protein XD40_2157 [Archaeoglobus fulgidus]KUK05859.1 MAG: Uncharacterized protein XD48_1902 [Archaeoglobus fulgidus]